MYFVDREKIEETLQYMESKIKLLNSTQIWETDVEKAALERIAHTIIESILDVGNSIIDGFIMRDPGSYEDIIDILEDEKVITEQISKSLIKIVAWRKILVQQYTSIQHQQMYQDFSIHMKAIEGFVPCVRTYIESELGPVSAFRN
ncbi:MULTISPECIES: DUF86 domain-containing protein [Heyndrickxia]|uniref:DUF86 domain-containing protein n=1 Tax=Heyndrickxia oleronia TaxID=38875 RepID=A0A8E2I8X9_9BACI|nr:DUF86 domain-containing protein [Heyndrickxia oleronia]NYV67996.1 DUF86 domain-containing protein [Bacillus sp. Gen3]MCI1591592.1 DUF86 domain-containing protein [Heyndrickxia oleronia]MCI1613022.1 DUF86 domain-containing protein [Heyndrickxia oleronia]MCI1744249.1 DUF86 domain-containing protein [Heyndrickxia oleronia]MCI1760861.1 DUF86 domain-containing protein [Heyndrickxia oleronia]